MDRSVKEKSQQIYGHPLKNKEADDQQSEAVQEEQLQLKRGRRKRGNKNSRKSVSFKWPWELDARLEHYRADRSSEEHRDVDRTEVVVKALDEFLSKEGYKQASKNS